MNILKKIGILFLLLITFSCVQTRQYVSYKTKKGDTIKDIAKRHKISESELLRINPGVSKNPPANTYIIVPKIANSKNQENTSKENTSDKNKEYSTYKVKKGDTLYSLSKRFGVTIDELKNNNPNLKDGLKIGMELVYIKDNMADNSIEKVDAKEGKETIIGYDLHDVVKGDTIYNLTHRYNISSEELYAANPQLTEGLKLGMTLKIPKKGIISDTSNEDTENTNNNLFIENFDTGKTANIAVLLPYQMNLLKNEESIEDKFKSKNSLTNIATDFHQGVEMAIDSLRRRGVQVEVSFFDTENSEKKITSLILENNLSEYDAIIGPLFLKNAEIIASQVESVPVILPFYSKKQSNNSSVNLIKSMPDIEKVEEKLIKYIEENYTNEKIIVVTDDKTNSKSRLWRVVNKLKAIDTIKDLSVLKPEKGYIDRERFNEKINENDSNWVILIGDDTVTISDVVNNLGAYPQDKYKIRLFAFEKGANFDGLVNNNYLSKLQFTYPTSAIYNNTSTPKLKTFYNNFKSKNHTLPNKYALRGFDITYDVIARLVSYNTLTDGIIQGKSERLTSVFEYDNQINKGIILAKYNKDLQIEIIE